VNVFADRIFDQLVFENLRVRELNDSDWNGGKFRKPRSPEATRSSDYLEAVQVQVTDESAERGRPGIEYSARVRVALLHRNFCGLVGDS
jgi:hypothetical protein